MHTGQTLRMRAWVHAQVTYLKDLHGRENQFPKTGTIHMRALCAVMTHPFEA